MPKYIFVTGGVCSSLGKGVAAASIGCLLEDRGLSVALQKIDPYINVDPGTMSPYQHGEVYVTDDGAETDLDLGNYERFTNAGYSKINSITTGQIYKNVIERERRGEYLGRTVQVIPHITDEIKLRIKKVGSKTNADVVIVEIGGTVGDIESIPFLEAIRQFQQEAGKNNVLYIHLTLIPMISVAGELKTKPTQHSVKELREIGIQPDILLCRTSKLLDEPMKSKLALFCNVEESAVIPAMDVAYSIYEVPIYFSEADIDKIIIDKLSLEAKEKKLQKWNNIVEVIRNPEYIINIAIVGKYIELNDAYKSIYEALVHGAVANNCFVKFIKIQSEDVKEDSEKLFKDIDGIIIPGGFGERGIEGKINTCRIAREKNIPLFGICLGMQCMVIEFARNVCGMESANTTEINIDTKYPIISLLEEQRGLEYYGGTMRLGAYPCKLITGTKVQKIYKEDEINERHRHRYEFNNKYKEELEQNGFKVAGISKENELVEIVELKEHPWYIGVQFHPEFRSKPTNVHPLFKNFMKISLEEKLKKGP